jgi:alginate biosynthesis protein AlgX
MTQRLFASAFVLSATLAAPAFADPSAFGCSNLDSASALPSLEGRDGVFYRVMADLRMRHPMEDPVVAQMAALSEALALGGTTLIYVTVPTKSQAMPDTLPASADDYAFDPATARLVYQDIIGRLSGSGVLAPDLMTALSAATPDEPAFFQADFHWTAQGARLAAQAIAEMVVAQPAYEDLALSEYRTVELERSAAFSTMRRTLQLSCVDELPRVEAVAHRTELIGAADEAVADIFAGGDDAVQVVLVGTSFSDSPLGNFAGFLAEFTGLDVVNYAVTGGNQFGGMTSYLTSRDFAENRPRFLIWENPIYNNLAQYGPDPMDELIAAAGQTCTTPLRVTQTGENSVTADLAGLTLGKADVVYADLGTDGPREALFSLKSATGITRNATIQRSDRMLASGRFYKPLGSVWHPDFTELTVTFDRPVSDATTLTLCPASSS